MDSDEEQKPDDAADIARMTQAAYAVLGAAKSGALAAGTALGAALGGPLGAAVGALAAKKKVWKAAAAVIAALFLCMYLIVNMVGILFSYMGFGSADEYAKEAQAAQLSGLKTQISLFLEQEEYGARLREILRAQVDGLLAEIEADKEEHYPEHELSVVNEYETLLSDNLPHYLAVLLTELWDPATIDSFLGISGSGGYSNLETDLTSPYDACFEEAATAYNVPAALLKAMGMAESGFNAGAVSPAGAIGVMQLMPATAASLGVSNPYDARQNIMGGAKYVAQNLEMFVGYPNQLELAVAAYNAGPGAVIQAGYQIPAYSETQNYVRKVLGYLTAYENSPETDAAESQSYEETDLSERYALLETAVTENLDRFFTWFFTEESEYEAVKRSYYRQTENGAEEIDQADYETLSAQGVDVWEEETVYTQKQAQYTLALKLDSQTEESGTGYSYKFVTSAGIFETVLKMLQTLSEGVDALKSALSSFPWTNLVTGADAAAESYYYGDIDVTGDVVRYDTAEGCVKLVTYYNQGEEPWASIAYGTSTIGSAGCGPTSLAIVISTLTGQSVTPRMTGAYAISNGEYVSGVGTAHSFPSNAAVHWGLTCERVGKDKMDYIVSSLKEGKMVVEICEAYTITGSGSGHFIVLTGVTEDGYITIADCASRERTAKIYSLETIRSYGRDLSEGAFWIIGKEETAMK